MTAEDRTGEVARIALLDNPIRAALYRELVERDDWLGRDEAAALVEVPRSVAAFHLEKLAEAGLVEFEYIRTSGRTGPGAGRPAKVFRRSRRETTVSIPERRYPLAGHILAKAVEESARTGKRPEVVVARIAADTARTIAAESRSGRKGSVLKRLADVLVEIGYEPRIVDGEILLRNCPFHQLAQEHVDLVCGINLDLLKGLIDGLSLGRMTARLDPAPGMCCVRIAKTLGTRMGK